MSVNKAPLARVQEWVRKKAGGLAELYETRASGPVGFVMRIFSWIGRTYNQKVWQRFAKNSGGSYTQKRVIGTIFGTFFALWLLPSAILTGWQIGLSQMTWQNETLYLTSAEEVDPENEIHSIRGCRAIPCSEADAVYFRVRSTWLHTVYSYYNRGHAFYPEEVAGVIAPGVNRCEVTSYGIRVKALMRGWGIYPDMLDAVCVPYSEAQASKAQPAEGEPAQ